MNAKLLYAWQKAAQQLLLTDPAESAEVRARPGQQTGDAGAGHVKKQPSLLVKCLRRIFASPDPMSPRHFMDQQRVHHPVRRLCQMG